MQGHETDDPHGGKDADEDEKWRVRTLTERKVHKKILPTLFHFAIYKEAKPGGSVPPEEATQFFFYLRYT